MRTLLCLAFVVLAAVLAGPQPLAAGEPSTVMITADKEHIDFKIGKELVARYHIAPTVAKPYFWPLKAPGGVTVTRAWPMEEAAPGGTKDHPHQKSAWFCHGDIVPEGIEVTAKIRGVKGVDFWSEAKGHGRMVCTGFDQPTLDPKRHAGSVTTRNEWRTSDGVKILDEVRTIRLYDFGKVWLFVLDIDLHASVAPLLFDDTKEGAMGVRVADAIMASKNGKGKIENAEGKVGEKECWGQLSNWCDYSGPIDGKTVGVAILDDPKNPYPACWHSRGYGLMAANPFGRARSAFPAMKGRSDLVRLAKGEHLRLRYGMLLHTGDAQEGQVAEYYQRFVKLRENP
jgi:hypothetical protein